MSGRRRSICVVTGSRAEYGLLYWLMKEIDQDPALELRVIVTGAHLSPRFGLTVRQVESDGFAVDARVEALAEGDEPLDVARAVGRGTAGFADALDRVRPDVVVLLGDRYEILAAAQATTLLGIPLAHIHGGELSEGVLDDAIRHCVTKLAQLHFVAAEPYRQRVIQLGEPPDRVYNFGAPGLDHLTRTTLPEKEELERLTGFAIEEPTLVVTYHPVTLGESDPTRGFGELLSAIDRNPGARVVLTKANADAGGRRINEMIDAYAQQHPGRVAAFDSLGIRNYLGLVRQADAVVGNSSSGLIEAPALRTATVNVGDRQRGRLRAASVIDCPEQAADVEAAIRRALSPEFRGRVRDATPPYGSGGASAKIKDVLKDVRLEGIVVKRFYDLPGGSDNHGGAR